MSVCHLFLIGTQTDRMIGTTSGFWKLTFKTVDVKKKKRWAILISGKLEFKAKCITRDNARHYMKIKESLYQEDVAILNAYIKQSFKIHEAKTGRAKRRNRNPVIVGDFNVQLSPIDRTAREKIEDI